MSINTTKPEHELSTGARPTGATNEQSAAANVQRMFDAIAPTYDRANHLLSVGIDRSWWTRTARLFGPLLQYPETVALDLCCGTGDMTMALLKLRPNATHTAPILAVDFSHQMLSLGQKKFAGRNVLPIEADALHLPLANASVDLVTSAFGFRNLANYEEGLAEIHRVLRPGGQTWHPRVQPARRSYRRHLQPLLQIHPAETRWPHHRQPARLQLPQLLGRTLPPPPAHDRSSPQSRLHPPNLDQLHLRRRRPLPRHKAMNRIGQPTIFLT